ncbi:MAG TPA: hypothetical protein VF735_14155 [Pyrinomonadaceae bacterium]|jgi:hypothetical protein
MAHELKNKWTSRIFSKGTGKFEDDEPGPEIDLTGISDDGTIAAGCTHAGEAIEGAAIRVETPSGYVVEFQHAREPLAFYKGVALRDPTTSEIHMIVGVKRVPATDGDDRRAKARTDGQIEATWVATQP